MASNSSICTDQKVKRCKLVESDHNSNTHRDKFIPVISGWNTASINRCQVKLEKHKYKRSTQLDLTAELAVI